MLTQKILKEILNYDPETGIFTWLTEPPNRPYLIGEEAGSLHPKGYIEIMINGISYKAHRLAILYIDGYIPEGDIDHEDRNKANNKYSNIREVSKQCNMRNRPNQRNNTSGIKGVSWREDNNNWRAFVIINKKLKSLGSFSDFTEAVAHRLAAEQCLNWSNCDSNSPANRYMKGL